MFFTIKVESLVLVVADGHQAFLIGYHQSGVAKAGLIVDWYINRISNFSLWSGTN